MSPEEEARLKRQVISIRVVLVLVVAALFVATAVIPELRGARTLVMVFGVGALMTSGSIADQVKYRAWRNKISRR